MKHKAEIEFLPGSLRTEKLTPKARNLIEQILGLNKEDLERSYTSSCVITKNGKIKVTVYINEILAGLKEKEEKFRSRFQEKVASLLKIPKDYIEISISSIGPF